MLLLMEIAALAHKPGSRAIGTSLVSSLPKYFGSPLFCCNNR
uniref:Uncharacterized protein n=1 Tax=Arundo donax TaxID=35708 RepID=A0A0A8ZI94_ARUDO